MSSLPRQPLLHNNLVDRQLSMTSWGAIRQTVRRGATPLMELKAPTRSGAVRRRWIFRNRIRRDDEQLGLKFQPAGHPHVLTSIAPAAPSEN